MNTKKNFVVYFKGKYRTIKISEHSSMIAAQEMCRKLKQTNGKGHPFISFSNPHLVKRMQVYG
jgi:hypothetical protein